MITGSSPASQPLSQAHTELAFGWRLIYNFTQSEESSHGNGLGTSSIIFHGAWWLIHLIYSAQHYQHPWYTGIGRAVSTSLLRLFHYPGFDHFYQGVVTYMSPVEAFATAIKMSDQQKNVLDHLLIPF